MHKFRRTIRHYFGFSRKETNGFLVMMVLMIILLVAPYVYSLFPSATELADYSNDQKTLDSLVNHLSASTISTQPSAPPQHFFTFNPNTLSKDSLMLLGISETIAARIVKYRNKGGRFYQKKDFKKIYGLKEAVYDRLHPYINIPQRQSKKRTYYTDYKKPDEAYQKRKLSPKKKKLVTFNLNNADTTELKQIRGIGSTYANRIVKYRNLLGGFVSMQQLKEVYGLPPEVLESLKAQCFIDEGFEPQRIAIQHVEWWELRQHPYVSDSLAKAIVHFRKSRMLHADNDLFSHASNPLFLSYLNFEN